MTGGQGNSTNAMSDPFPQRPPANKSETPDPSLNSDAMPVHGRRKYHLMIMGAAAVGAVVMGLVIIQGLERLTTNDPPATVVMVELPDSWMFQPDDPPPSPGQVVWEYYVGQPRWTYVWQDGEQRSFNTPHIVLHTSTDNLGLALAGSRVEATDPFQELERSTAEPSLWGGEWVEGPVAFSTPDGGEGAYAIYRDSNGYVSATILTRWYGAWTRVSVEAYTADREILLSAIDAFTQATLPESSQIMILSDTLHF